MVGRDRPDAELVGESQYGVLRRAHECAAQVDRDARDVAGIRTPAYPVTALEHQHVVTQPAELAGRGEAGETGTHHDDVCGPSRVRHVLQSTPSMLRNVGDQPTPLTSSSGGPR